MLVTNMEDLNESERRIVDSIRFDMNQMKEELLSKLAEKDRIIEKLNGDVSSLKATVSRLEDKIDENDAYERRDTLIFCGKSLPAVSPTEKSEEF